MIFLSSDHHFHHANVITYCKRPFSSVEEMNEEMVKRWNGVVKPEDTVYYLGDFSLAQRAVPEFGPRLNGIKHLFMGNHDHCHPCHKSKAEGKRKIYYDAGFKTIEMHGELEVAGQKVTISHMPYWPDQLTEGYEMKYKEFRPTNQGLWLLHGHVHEKWKTNGKMINVGVDAWNFYPVAIDDIATLITTDN